MKNLSEYYDVIEQIERTSSLSANEALRIGIGQCLFDYRQTGKLPSAEDVASTIEACQYAVSLAELLWAAGRGDFVIAYDEEGETFVTGHPGLEMDMSQITTDLPLENDDDRLLISHVAMTATMKILEQNGKGDNNGS